MNEIASDILKFLAFSQKLKSQQRTIKLSENRHESSADHSWHLAIMAMAVAPHLKEKIDLLKSLKMVLIHDLVEAEIGDTPYGDVVLDRDIKAEKKRKENEEIEKIKKLVGGELGDEIHELWYEFEEKKTSEAKFVKALDSLEANHQSIMYDINYWENWFYPVALTKADKYCGHEEILGAINAEITKNMKKKFDEAGIELNKI
ncbi:MAG: hypothetical protein ACD_56C00114G0003 [uncultured bacterium]|nr:MAG: hypothetical protein ACD_56C00114G0003 [uncultured bacterium]